MVNLTLYKILWFSRRFPAVPEFAAIPRQASFFAPVM
jgi:hypothetical protein